MATDRIRLGKPNLSGRRGRNEPVVYGSDVADEVLRVDDRDVAGEPAPRRRSRRHRSGQFEQRMQQSNPVCNSLHKNPRECFVFVSETTTFPVWLYVIRLSNKVLKINRSFF